MRTPLGLGLSVLSLAHHSTLGEAIAALRAQAFSGITPLFDPVEVANLARHAHPTANGATTYTFYQLGPVSVRVNCRMLTAERLITFAKELSAQLPADTRQETMRACREFC